MRRRTRAILCTTARKSRDVRGQTTTAAALRACMRAGLRTRDGEFHGAKSRRAIPGNRISRRGTRERRSPASRLAANSQKTINNLR